MSKDKNSLLRAVRNHRIPQLVVGYLKLQQAKSDDFFTLLMHKKINGRLFYNTCLPNGAKEIRYSNEDFLEKHLQAAIDDALSPFHKLSLADINSELIKPANHIQAMQQLILTLMNEVESSKEWRKFWESEIILRADDDQKKALYNEVAGAAAFKILMSSLDNSKTVNDPMIKNNIKELITICSDHFSSMILSNESEFMFIPHEDITANLNTTNDAADFKVFKKQHPAQSRQQNKESAVRNNAPAK